MKQTLKRLLPKPILTLKRKLHVALTRRRWARLTLAEVFRKTYDEKLWGTSPGSHFCSGSGSRGRVAQAYIEFVRTFISRHGIQSVVDLGCGDFFIGSQIAPLVPRYLGVDIVPELINHLNATHGSPHVQFRCLDITTHSLPGADLCLVRQVFQHLSNDEIRRVLPKLQAFPFVLVTEHYPAEARVVVPNRDKPHGPDTRLVDDSGVYLDQPPFGQAAQLVLSVDAEEYQVAKGEKIRTFLIRHGDKASVL
jgi:SAM-dependent methyltransferase